MAVKLNISLVLLLILFGANCETIYVKFFDTPIKGPDKDHPFKVGVISYGIVPLRKPEILPVVNKKINPMIFVEGSDYVCIEQHTDLDLYTTKQEIDKVKFIFKRSMDFRGFSDFDKSSKTPSALSCVHNFALSVKTILSFTLASSINFNINSCGRAELKIKHSHSGLFNSESSGSEIFIINFCIMFDCFL